MFLFLHFSLNSHSHPHPQTQQSTSSSEAKGLFRVSAVSLVLGASLTRLSIIPLKPTVQESELWKYTPNDCYLVFLYPLYKEIKPTKNCVFIYLYSALIPKGYKLLISQKLMKLSKC